MNTPDVKPVRKPVHIVLALCCSLLVLVAASAGVARFNAPAPPDLAFMFDAKESFHYEVRYGFMRLGDVYVSAQDTVIDGTTYLHTTSVMQSNSGIPLVGDRRYKYHSILAHNDSTVYSRFFWVDKIHRDSFEYVAYEFDYEKGYVIASKEGEVVDTLDLSEPSDGGPALFYIGRLHAGTDREMEYPIYIDEEKAYIQLRHTTQTEQVRSGYFENGRTEAFLTHGFADVDGPFGFSGAFESYYDTSELRMPVEAKVSVWIGNVRVRLVDYQDNGKRLSRN